MTFVAVGSVKGTAGTSTAALALATANARTVPTVLVEADPSGGSLLAWCDQLEPRQDVFDATTHAAGTEWWVHAQQLGPLSVLPARGDEFRIAQALRPPRGGWTNFFDAGEIVSFVDVGRIQERSPSWEVLRAADVVVVVAPLEPGPLASTTRWFQQHTKGDRDSLTPGRVMLLTNDVTSRRRAGSRLTGNDLADMSGLPRPLGHLGFDAAAVDALCRGELFGSRRGRRRRLERNAKDALSSLSRSSTPHASTKATVG